MALSKMQNVDFILVGKTGVGKSAVGNSILKRKAFVSKCYVSSVTRSVASEVTEYKGRIIKVVDTPGMGNTNMDDESGQRLVADSLEQAMSTNPNGFHAFLLVIRYGGRFVQEDRDTIEVYRNLLGKSFIRKFCIVVMTWGDVFEGESEETDETFDTYCEGQEGLLKELLLECENRIVLFDNSTRDDTKKDTQLDNLLAIIDGLWRPGHRYTKHHFEKAKAPRERRMLKAKLPQITEEIMQRMSRILQELETVKTKLPEQQAQPLNELLGSAEELLEDTVSKDKGTGVLGSLLEHAEEVKRQVGEEMRVCRLMLELKLGQTPWQLAQKRRVQEKIKKIEDMCQELRQEIETMK